MDVIVGLGNPGRRYQHTRHNLGFDVIDMLARRYEMTLQQIEAKALGGKGGIGSRAVVLVKPQTYMNRSGQSVAPLVRRYRKPGEQLVVIHDDIDLSLGTVKIKQRGGDAGHLGVRSIIECLGSGDFVRIRMGVGRPSHQADIVDYVLSPFSADEAETHHTMIAQAATCVETLLAAADHAYES